MKNKTEARLSDRPALSPRRKLQIFWRDYEWPIILAVGLAGLALGYVGFTRHAAATGQSLSFLDLLYRILQLIPMESGAVEGPVSWQLEVARLVIPAVTAYAATKAFTVIFREQMHLIHLWFIKDHIVICGLGQKGFLLAQHFRQRKESVVVIEQDEDNTLLSLARERGAVVIVGDATDTALLHKAATQRAKHLISVCGDDGTNAEVAVCTQELTGARPKGVLTCIIHIVDPQLCDLLREQELGTDQFSPFRLQLFNIFDRGARRLLQEHPPFNENGNAPHILIVGLGKLGENLAIRAARQWQDTCPSPNRQLRLTIIDKKVDWKLGSLCVRYPQLSKVCRLLPHQIDIRSPEFQRAEFLFDDQGQGDMDIIYVCLGNDSINLHTGLTLLSRIRHYPTPIIIRMAEHSGLATLLHDRYDSKGAFKNLHAFGLLDHTCTPDIVLGGAHEILAQALHQEYVRHQKQSGQTTQTNPAMVPWNSLPESLKESNRRQVDYVRKKLQAIGVGVASSTGWDIEPFEFRPEEVELMARMEHERWIEERLHEGWKYAPGPKNLKKKTNPDLVPWEKLPEAAKEWNYDSARELPTFLAQAGFQIYRLE